MNSSIKRYLEEKAYNLREDKELIRAWADVKINLSANQDEFAGAVGISSRTLRNKIQKDKDYFNICIEEFTKEAEKANSSLTEAQLSAFVDNIIKLGTNPTSAKDLQVFAEFFAITPDQVKRIMQIKGYSFRGWLREADLDWMDKEKLFKNLLTVDVLYNQNHETVGATEKALDIDLNNPLDQYRLMYMGAVFLSLYNQHDYEELTEELALLMQLEQIAQGSHIEIDRQLRKQAEQMAGTYKAPESARKTVDEVVKEIGLITAGIGSELTDTKTVKAKAKPKAVFPDKEIVKQRKREHQKELDGYLKPHEEIQRMLNSKEEN